MRGVKRDGSLGVNGEQKHHGINDVMVGFIEGAMAVNQDNEVRDAYSVTFGDPAEGEQMAKAMFDDGADIVYQVAGGTGIGIIKASKARGHYAIGVDTDQDGLAPGSVLTSMIKRVDVAVEQIINEYSGGSFPGGTVMNFGLAESGVALSDMIHTKHMVPSAYLTMVDGYKAAIIAGDIDVWDVSTEGYPDFFK